MVREKSYGKQVHLEWFEKNPNLNIKPRFCHIFFLMFTLKSPVHYKK